MVTLTLLRLDVPDDDVMHLAQVLSDDERARAGRFRQPEDRRRYVVTRASLRYLLAHHLALDVQALVLSQTEHGKPVLATFDAGGNAQPMVHFNVSHSGAWAAIAVGQHPIGVDIEQRRSLDVLAVGAHVFDAPTLEAIARAEDSEAAFFMAWTAREALLKARGTGLVDTDVARLHSATSMTVNRHPVARDGDVCIEPFAVAPDYYGAVCVLAPSLTLTRHVAADTLHRLPPFSTPG